MARRCEAQPSDLPGILCEIARETAVETSIAIAREFGGRRLYVPMADNLDPQHPLAKLIGIDAARLICARWGRDRHDIPAARTFLRWYDARRLRREGKSHAEISRELGIGMNRVAILLKGFNEGIRLVRGGRKPRRGGNPGTADAPPAQNRFLTGSNGGYSAISGSGAAEGPSAPSPPCAPADRGGAKGGKPGGGAA